MQNSVDNIVSKGIRFLIWGLLAYGIGFAFWTVFATETGNGDNVEHLHATWLVAYHKIPYKDFFQHHNPMIWYIFSPLMYLSSDIKFLLDMVHFIGILGGIATFYIVCKMSVRFFATKYSSLLSLLIVCPAYYYIFCFNYNPDTFMALFFAIGVYQLFCYLDKHQLQKLIISFVSFFIAFLFTQKILIVYIPLGLITLFVFYQEKKYWKDLFWASMLPFVGLLLFVAYLYHHGALELYYKSNYPFNVRMQDYYGPKSLSVMDYKMLVFAVCTSIASIGLFFKSETKYFKITSILFIIELLERCFYFSIAPYYMLPLMIYMACLNSVLIRKLWQKSYLLIIPFLCVASYYAIISAPKYLSSRGRDRGFVEFLTKNLTPCDYVISSYFGNQSIITKDPHYYWSMLGHIDVVGDELGIASAPKINELIEKYKPKFIYGGVYWNSYARNRGEDIIWQTISSDLIKQYYLPTPFSDFYILKYEYRRNNCHYNQEKREWLYRD